MRLDRKTKLKLKAILQSMIEHDIAEWSPVCAGFAYQPKRPNNSEAVNSTLIHEKTIEN